MTKVSGIPKHIHLNEFELQTYFLNVCHLDVHKGIKLSYLIEVFHSISTTIDAKLETRTIAQFSNELQRKLKMVCSENPDGQSQSIGKISSDSRQEVSI